MLVVFGSDDLNLDVEVTDVPLLTNGAMLVVVVAALTFVFVDTG